MVPDLAPMLADRGLPRGNLAGWAAEPKLDGWRVAVTLTQGRVNVRTRRGHDVTDRLPGIEVLTGIADQLFLDGELVAGAGRANDFYDLLPRVAGQSRRPVPTLSFWAFDLLYLDGELLTGRPYTERRTALEGLRLPHPARILSRWPATDTADLLAACADLGVEGVVLKRLRSTYLPGRRSTGWRKIKTPEWAAVHAQRRTPR